MFELILSNRSLIFDTHFSPPKVVLIWQPGTHHHIYISLQGHRLSNIILNEALRTFQHSIYINKIVKKIYIPQN